MIKLKYSKNINLTYGLIKNGAGGCEINEKPLQVSIEIETDFLVNGEVAKREDLDQIIKLYDHCCLSSFIEDYPNMENLASRLYSETREKLYEIYDKAGLNCPKIGIVLIGESKSIEYRK